MRHHVSHIVHMAMIAIVWVVFVPPNQPIPAHRLETIGRSRSGLVELIENAGIFGTTHDFYGMMQCYTGASRTLGSVCITEVCSCIHLTCPGVSPGCTKPCRTHGGNTKTCPFPPKILMCNPTTRYKLLRHSRWMQEQTSKTTAQCAHRRNAAHARRSASEDATSPKQRRRENKGQPRLC